jgi:hypothetical protein
LAGADIATRSPKAIDNWRSGMHVSPEVPQG